jgi:hypothetical protein
VIVYRVRASVPGGGMVVRVGVVAHEARRA